MKRDRIIYSTTLPSPNGTTVARNVLNVTLSIKNSLYNSMKWNNTQHHKCMANQNFNNRLL